MGYFDVFLSFVSPGSTFLPRNIVLTLSLTLAMVKQGYSLLITNVYNLYFFVRNGLGSVFKRQHVQWYL